MTTHEVLIVGGGPTGLVLAGELKLAGVDAAIVERRLNQDVAGSRAGGLHARALEELDQRGIAERFIAQGKKHSIVPFPGAMLDSSDLPTRHNYSLGLFQERIERTLADWVEELGVHFYRGAQAAGFTQNDAGVDLTLSDGRTLRAQYLVGCDGGRSLIRKQAGIAFPGWEASLSYLIFEGEMDDDTPWGMRHSERGVIAVGKLDDGHVRGVLVEQELKHGDEPTMDELRQAVVAAYGADYGVRNVTWLSRFTDAARQAAAYRERRVLLAGDAAHVHSPTGGQGLNIGVQDAMNLGWKLAQVAKGVSPNSLLDTYHAERHPIGARVIKHTLAITALSRGDERTNALREMLPSVMQMDQPRKWYGAMMSSLDIRHDFGEGHPLLGRRMPDLDIVTTSGAERVFTLLHEARPVLINFGQPGAIDITAWAGRVKQNDARYDSVWELPAIGAVAAPESVLIRPDGYVAWVGGASHAGLEEAMTKWFGPPN